jgi:hypothetical protein
MTWLVTWPTRGGGVGYEEARNETAAEARAEQIVRNGTAKHAVAYEIGQEELTA